MFDTQRLFETSRAFGDHLHEALNYQDSDLTPEGLAKRREDMASRVRQTYRRQVDEHRSALYRDRDRNAFDRHRIHLDWNNPGQVAKAQSKWAAAKEKLAAGISIGEVIAHADEPTLAAVREFWGDYADAQRAGSLPNGQTFEPVDTTVVLRAVDERTAVVKNAEGAFRTATEATAAAASAQVTLDHLEGVCDGRTNEVTDFGTALAAKEAEGRARATGTALIEAHDAAQEAASQEPATAS